MLDQIFQQELRSVCEEIRGYNRKKDKIILDSAQKILE